MTNFTQTPIDNLPVTRCLLSLASNYQPTYYLSQVLAKFEHTFPLENISLSDILISQDKNTIKSSPIYHNQMAILYFKEPILLGKLTQLTKHIESFLDRQKFIKPIVTLDIDIIAFGIKEINFKNDNKEISIINYQENSLIWYKINRRFPLADYEILGLENLISKNTISYTFIKSILT